MAQTPEVVILHGWSREAKPSAKWQPIVDELVSAQIKTTVLQLPGFELPLTAAWGIAEYTAWLNQVLLKKSNLIIVGHSFGGHLAISYTARFPDRVQQLVLIASAGFRSHSLAARAKRAFFWVLAKTGKLLTTSDSLRGFLYKATRERDYFVADPILRETMQKIIKHEVDDELLDIQIPTTVIWGSQDKITPLAFIARIQKGIPHAKVELVAGARHGIPFTHSSQVAKLIIKAIHA